VEFDDARSAQNAIAMFNNYNFEGRTIHVREDREAGGASLATPNQESRILVSNLPFRAEWQELKDLCAPYGTVVRADVDVLPDGRSKGSGTVVFASQADAWACIRGLNGQTVEGRILGVHADNHYGALAPAARHSGAPIAPVQSDQNARIFISNLPFRAEWQELKDLCAPYGTVVRADVDELPDGRSKGTGTVVFASQADAWSCIRGLNGQTVEGRVLGVHADNHHPSNGQSGTPLAGFKVYVGNLPWSCSWQNLKDLGRPFGEVSFADLALEPSGRSRGFGVLTFSHANSAQACIKNLHGTIFEDRDLVVHEDSRA
jgi:RNA recognition motif-containing protein